MPKPPILPVLDWAAIFQSGKTYAKWLEEGKSKSSRDAMTALADIIELTDDDIAMLQSITKPVHVVAIAEDWCPDVVRHVPVLMKMVGASEIIRVSFLQREDRPDVFARFLTLGGEAIPKFVFLSDQFVECGHWGPMQADCREFIARGKACGDMKTAREKVFERYQDDSSCTIVVKELRELFEIASCTAVDQPCLGVKA